MAGSAQAVHTGEVAGFVPAGFDGAKWERIEPLGRALLQRKVGSAREFERWLIDRSDFDAACAEARANLYIAMTCRTDDAAVNAAWTKYLDDVAPKLKPLAFELDRRQVDLYRRFAAELDRSRHEVLERNTRLEVEMFRAENVPLETEVEKLNLRFNQLCSEMTVEFEGATRTLAQMARFLEEPDRSLRERAWRGIWQRRLRDREAIESIFDDMLVLRDRIARNAGFPDFRDYQHRRYGRFDYSPRDCMAFHAAVEEHVVPFKRRIDERRRRRMGLESLRPWDMAVDEQARPPLRPFEGGDDLVRKSRRLFLEMEKAGPASNGSGSLAAMFAQLGDNGAPGECLDLDSRKGKSFGGYQYMRDFSRRPFIFMNAAGVHSDVETMVHEAGHAFHSMLCRDEPLLAYRTAPIEFAEVASMSMELLSMPWWNVFYPSPEDCRRAVREHIERSVSYLTWMATIDAFQQWVYTNPRHSRTERRTFWLGLDARFGANLNWDGDDLLRDARAWQWQRQIHLFSNPFYYIEYAIAQLGALGLWMHAVEHGHASALARYRRALSLGGSRPLPELFHAAGLPFDFGSDHVGAIVRAVERELEKLGD